MDQVQRKGHGRGGFNRGGGFFMRGGKNIRKIHNFKKGKNLDTPKYGQGCADPRSPYKDNIDLGDLAERFPKLQKYLSVKPNGALTLDFMDRKSLCALTEILAKRDFDLDLELPFDRMVPILPMRLNYLLWVEDLLDKWPPETIDEFVNGIDIGANASCLYALVAARKNKWKMLTSEHDEKAYNFAMHNILKNDLDKFVTVKKVNENTFLDGVIDPDVLFYDFCMFSPAFMSNKDAKVSMGKVDGQFLPNSLLSGKAAELIAPGGEQYLMRNIISESVKFKCKVKLFSIMVGKMSTADILGSELVELVGDDYVASDTFYYGPQRNYGLAWTFDKNVKLRNMRRLSFRFLLPKHKLEMKINNTNISDAYSCIIALLGKIMVNCKVLERTDEMYSMEINTYHAFWTNKGRAEADNLKKCSADVGNSSRTPHSGNTLVLKADLNILKEGNDVVIHLSVTGGTSGVVGGRQVMAYLTNDWYNHH